MTKDLKAKGKWRKRLSSRQVPLVVGVSVCLAAVCFTLVVVLPSPKESLLENPLRGVLTGVGALAVSLPLYIAGAKIKRRSLDSPGFDEAFITGVFNVFGFACTVVGLVCIGFAVYSLIQRVLDSAA